MKNLDRLAAGKMIEAAGFKIMPVCRQEITMTKSGGFCSMKPEGLIFVSGDSYLKFSFKCDDSWIEEFLNE